MKRSLAQRMAEGGYDGYAYAYPHKTAYRPLNPPVPLRQAWQFEEKRHLHLYVHLPFCEMRCGFCNLFTTAQPGSNLVDDTLSAIRRQSEIVAMNVESAGIAQLAFGGGTPSFLVEHQIEELFTELTRRWLIRWGSIPASFEVSPGTVTREKLRLLRSVGVDRISLGVQSFVAEDLVALKRPQPRDELEQACHLIKSSGFPVFNLDLIYGVEGQDRKRWQRSLDAALEWQSEEIYLYPLYVGKLTKLDRCGKRPAERRKELYEQASDTLLAAGYRQISMRLFRKAGLIRATDYCCQDDGMIGLGPGARSYTRALHYSTEYAVGQTGVKSIIEQFNTRDDAAFASADYGASLDLPEQKRRFVIKSLLRAGGLFHPDYQHRFGTLAIEDFPHLAELIDLSLATATRERLELNAEGLAWSDTIGPWLYSEATVDRMSAYAFA